MEFVAHTYEVRWEVNLPEKMIPPLPPWHWFRCKPTGRSYAPSQNVRSKTVRQLSDGVHVLLLRASLLDHADSH